MWRMWRFMQQFRRKFREEADARVTTAIKIKYSIEIKCPVIDVVLKLQPSNSTAFCTSWLILVLQFRAFMSLNIRWKKKRNNNSKQNSNFSHLSMLSFSMCFLYISELPLIYLHQAQGLLLLLQCHMRPGGSTSQFCYGLCVFFLFFSNAFLSFL